MLLTRTSASYRTPDYTPGAAVHFITGTTEVRKPPSEPLPWAGAEYDAEELHSRIGGIITLGYPLAHAKQDRSAPLKRVDAATRMLFVVGTRDAIALGASLDLKPLRKALAGMDAETALHVVEAGGHNPFSLPKKSATQERDSIMAAIQAFCGGG